MKQTAVDWLMNELSEINRPDLVSQAKEMEKQQLVKAAASAFEDMFGTDGTEYGEKYYDKLTQDDK